MKNARRLFLSAGLLLTIAAGSLALLTPTADAGNCPRSCPPIKKLHGYPCQFVGCDPATNACMYAC
ncbi:MAG TPA: hypothetical protein VFB67_10840 [Candidatus Polarisedimenticolaceae bacterium]|nr:hypothetical protein [Candidatus Polarisedimenticolaceae bacterium]